MTMIKNCKLQLNNKKKLFLQFDNSLLPKAKGVFYSMMINPQLQLKKLLNPSSQNLWLRPKRKEGYFSTMKKGTILSP